MELVDLAVWCSQRVGRHVVVTTCHAKNIRKMADLQTTPRQGCATTLWGRGAPNQGPGRYFGDCRRPGSRSSHPQCAPPKSLRILLWASRFSKIRSIFGLVGRASSASATPGPKPPNKGWGRTFMDVPSAPTKSGNERLTHLKALGFYFGLHVLTRIDPNRAHRSN